MGSGRRLRRWLSQRGLSWEAKYWGAGCCAELNKGLPAHGRAWVGERRAANGGRGGVVPPPCSCTPTQAPCHRQAPVTHAESHHDTSAPTQARQPPTAPQRPVVGGQRSGAVPTQPPAPPRTLGMAGGDTHTHLSTTQPLARVGTRAVGAVPALAQLLAVALQLGLGGGLMPQRGSAAPPPPHAIHTCAHMHSSARTRVHAHTRMHILHRTPSPSPPAPPPPSWPAGSRGERSWL